MGRSQCANIILIVIMAILITSYNLVEAASDAQSCITNSDCTPKQYCYGSSQTCVDYIPCIRYKREEGPKQAESSAQCGPCIPGYVADLLATGTEAPICRKNSPEDKKPIVDEETLSKWIYIAAGIILCVILIMLLAYLLKNRVAEHGGEKWFKKMAGWNVTPTAPPPDTGVYHLQPSCYNDEEPPVYSAMINNNTTAKDKNKLVSAVPYHPGCWIDLRHSYDVPDNATNDDIVTPEIDIEDEETNPSSWVPDQVVVQVPPRPFHQFAPEQRDNALNNVLIRDNCASNGESTPDTNSQGSTGPDTTGHSRTTGDTYRGTSVQINQMITLNMVTTEK